MSVQFNQISTERNISFGNNSTTRRIVRTVTREAATFLPGFYLGAATGDVGRGLIMGGLTKILVDVSTPMYGFKHLSDLNFMKVIKKILDSPVFQKIKK